MDKSGAVRFGAKILDGDWLATHPLQQPDLSCDKNSRGRVLIVGGSSTVPGGIRLSAEAALRAGAGKVQVLTIESAALPIGLLLPEIAVFPAPERNGEIGPCGTVFTDLLDRADAVLIGPAMTDAGAARMLLEQVIVAQPSCSLVIDAAGLLGLRPLAAELGRLACPVLLTPNAGEMVALLDWDFRRVEEQAGFAALSAAESFGTHVLLKGATSYLATPSGDLYAVHGGGVGLATGGSGDVLAGIAVGLLAHQDDFTKASLWSSWAHAEAGRQCSETIGATGFLARELLPLLPAVLASSSGTALPSSS